MEERPNITSSELALLGILALFAAAIWLVPWQQLILKYRQYEARKYSTFQPNAADRRNNAAKTDWQTQASYSAAEDSLEIDLRHRQGKPAGDMWLLASFYSPDPHKAPVHSVLRQGEAGRFRASGVRLDKGEWLMSLTGIARDAFVFRSEQVLDVR